MTNRDFELTCCSTADLTYELMEQRGIEMVGFHFVLEDEDYLDDMGHVMTSEDFFERMSNGAMPTTATPGIGQYMKAWRPYLEAGKDILHIGLSSGLSSAYMTAIDAAKAMGEEFPERKIKVIDSLGASSGYGLLVTYAADMRDAGKSMDEISQWLTDNCLHMHHWFFSTDLTSYFRGGRISRTSALVAGALRICPLMNMNDEGKLIPREKYRGKKLVSKKIVERMEQHAEGGLDYSGKCFISHAACYEDARKVADLVESKFPHLAEPVQIFNIGTVVGSHTGPSTVALYFLGDKRVN